MSADLFVLVGFLIFFGILFYMGVPGLITKALDDRSALIKAELEEARRLKEEAQALLAEYQAKREGAEQEAQAIVEQARKDAQLMAQETRTAMEETIKRRTRMAEDKIARAEEQAASDVRGAAADLAVEAARDLIQSRMQDGSAAGSMLDKSIAELKARMN